MDKNYKVSILWGSSPEPGDRTITYAYETAAELEAFIDGVDEACGWMDWDDTYPEGYVVPAEGKES
jgi:hypothetical protein